MASLAGTLTNVKTDALTYDDIIAFGIYLERHDVFDEGVFLDKAGFMGLGWIDYGVDSYDKITSAAAEALDFEALEESEKFVALLVKHREDNADLASKKEKPKTAIVLHNYQALRPMIVMICPSKGVGDERKIDEAEVM